MRCCLCPVQVAEGVATAGVVVSLARKYRVQLPVLTAVAQVGGVRRRWGGGGGQGVLVWRRAHAGAGCSCLCSQQQLG